MDEHVVGPDLTLTTETTGNQGVVSVKGELDAYTAPAIEEQISRLVDGGITDIVLDLSETSFLDSSGLRAILTAHRRLERDLGKTHAARTERIGHAAPRNHRSDRPLPNRSLRPDPRAERGMAARRSGSVVRLTRPVERDSGWTPRRPQ